MQDRKVTKAIRWPWIAVCGFLPLALYVFGLITAAAALFLTAVLAIVFVLSLRQRSRKAELMPIGVSDEPEQFTLQFPEPGEHGWHRYTVTPAKLTFEEQKCYGGPPVTVSVFQYTVKSGHVFAQLIDSREDDFAGTHFEVINGQVLDHDIRLRKPWEWTDSHIEDLNQQVVWREIEGSLRYFVLSLHGWGKEQLSKEHQRMENGFAALAREAAALGAIRENRGAYHPPETADQQTQQAILDLQQRPRLERFGISFAELIDYEHVHQTLKRLISSPEVRQ